MKSKTRAKLFLLEAYLNKEGNVEMNYEAVKPEDLERELNTGLPMYSGTSQVASLLRYLRKCGDDIMSGSRNYI
jgi:hypothetical protein